MLVLLLTAVRHAAAPPSAAFEVCGINSDDPQRFVLSCPHGFALHAATVRHSHELQRLFSEPEVEEEWEAQAERAAPTHARMRGCSPFSNSLCLGRAPALATAACEGRRACTVSGAFVQQDGDVCLCAQEDLHSWVWATCVPVPRGQQAAAPDVPVCDPPGLAGERCQLEVYFRDTAAAEVDAALAVGAANHGFGSVARGELEGVGFASFEAVNGTAAVAEWAATRGGLIAGVVRVPWYC